MARTRQGMKARSAQHNRRVERDDRGDQDLSKNSRHDFRFRSDHRRRWQSLVEGIKVEMAACGFEQIEDANQDDQAQKKASLTVGSSPAIVNGRLTN
jgi:hypothetical protein